MAKQSGIHQLRGKVGEHSYYRQTGVNAGLVRSINPGLSARVKESAEYANVRLNNAEFGQAGRISSIIAKYINPKYRAMVLPFSQSKMAKVLLEYLKLDTTHPWGERNLMSANSGIAQVEALNSVAKNAFDEFGLKIVGDEENNHIVVSTSPQTLEKLAAIGADGFSLRLVVFTTWIGTYNNGKYGPSNAIGNTYITAQTEPAPDEDFEFNYTLRPAPSPGINVLVAERCAVLMVLPYRTINNENHTLQENCTYFSWVIRDGQIN